MINIFHTITSSISQAFIVILVFTGMYTPEPKVETIVPKVIVEPTTPSVNIEEIPNTETKKIEISIPKAIIENTIPVVMPLTPTTPIIIYVPTDMTKPIIQNLEPVVTTAQAINEPKEISNQEMGVAPIYEW